VTFRADDGRGAECTGSVIACVPGRSVPDAGCTEAGAAVDATAPECTGFCAAACSVERTLGHATCAGEIVPPQVERLVGKARRLMVRAGKNTGKTAPIGAAVRSIERAARLATTARSAGTLSPTCADAITQVLGNARAGAEQALATRRATSTDDGAVRGTAPARRAGSKRSRRPGAAARPSRAAVTADGSKTWTTAPPTPHWSSGA
jgi:hypothetical protein